MHTNNDISSCYVLVLVQGEDDIIRYEDVYARVVEDRHR